jgi:copper chaperone for superoxide dismutase
MVQVSPTLTLFDLTLRGLSPGTYVATIRQTGDISNGAISTLGIWNPDTSPSTPTPSSTTTSESEKPKGFLATITIALDGTGSAFIDKPIQIWEMIGRGMVVSREGKENGEGRFERNDEDTLVGVVARSAGVWDNDKTVCSCSGKTLWEERREEVGKGML